MVVGLPRSRTADATPAQRDPQPTHPLFATGAAFAVLMLCGELVKIRFLRSTGFTVRNASASIVIGLTTAYALLFALAALVWVWR